MFEQRRLETALSPLPGHPHALVRHLFLSSVSSSSVFGEGGIEMSLGQVSDVSHLWLLKYLSSHKGDKVFWASDVLARSLLSLRHVHVFCLSL